MTRRFERKAQRFAENHLVPRCTCGSGMIIVADFAEGFGEGTPMRISYIVVFNEIEIIGYCMVFAFFRRHGNALRGALNTVRGSFDYFRRVGHKLAMILLHEIVNLFLPRHAVVHNFLDFICRKGIV
jgi:hypothetical protein